LHHIFDNFDDSFEALDASMGFSSILNLHLDMAFAINVIPLMLSFHHDNSSGVMKK
jgi:hypothetical protein